MRKFVVVIPAYQPKRNLPAYVKELINEGVPEVIVVDDGNDSEFDELFTELSRLKACTVLHHEMNSGKGAALKTGFQYFLRHLSHFYGVVTADADDQHLVKDVLSVGKRVEANRVGFVLGARDFERKNMPVRSFIGNKTTSRIFQLLFGLFVKDTQTGLRGLATSELDWVCRLRGDHFEFEMNMLINMLKKRKRIVQVDIEVVYEEVHISHYDTYRDSARIAGQIVREYVGKLK